MDELIFSKIESIEKCLKRIESKVKNNNFDLDDYDTQDVVVLNLQRACQQAIDLAMFIVADGKLGFPKDSSDAFNLLYEAQIINEDTEKKMRGMVGFRNVAVHEYQRVDMKIVDAVIRNNLDDFREYNSLLIKNCCS